MRKLKIMEHIALDGVLQTSGDDGDFPYGDWTAPYRTPAGRDALLAAHGEKFDLLLGRRTYDAWSGLWPTAPSSPMADGLNAAKKYVATHRPESLEWGPRALARTSSRAFAVSSQRTDRTLSPTPRLARSVITSAFIGSNVPNRRHANGESLRTAALSFKGEYLVRVSFQRTPLRTKNGRRSSIGFKDGSTFLRTIAPYQQVTSSDAIFWG
jgi:hypothetical protein